jgi:D-alanyl-D-alanine carboxypeptidase
MTIRRTASALLSLAFSAGFAVAEAPLASEDPRVTAAVELARTWVEAQRAYDRLPGVSVAIVEDQRILWIGGFGYADLAGKRPATADTLYSIC